MDEERKDEMTTWRGNFEIMYAANLANTLPDFIDLCRDWSCWLEKKKDYGIDWKAFLPQPGGMYGTGGKYQNRNGTDSCKIRKMQSNQRV